MMLPKPWQVGHAPNGLLNENRRGCGSSYGSPQVRHSNRSENRCVIAACPERRRRFGVASRRVRQLNGPRRATAFRIRGFHRIGDARARIGRHLDAIDDHAQRGHRLQRGRIDVFERHGLSVHQQAPEPLAPQVLQRPGPTATRPQTAFRRAPRRLPAPRPPPMRSTRCRSPPPGRSPASGACLRAARAGGWPPLPRFRGSLPGRTCGRWCVRRAQRAGACSRESR